MIGNTGDTQPVKVPGLPLCIRFRGKPDDLKKFSYQAVQDPEKKLLCGIDRPDSPTANVPLSAAPLSEAPLSGLSAQKAEAPEMAPEDQPEEDLLVVRPRSADRRAEDFMRDWMRRFTRA